MGIYSSNLSCWERSKRGLCQDNAGPETIVQEEEIAIKTPEIIPPKPDPKEVETTKSTVGNKSSKNKDKGKK